MSEAARRELLERARQRQQEQGRRGLRRTPPRPRRPEQQIRQYRAALRDVARALESEVRERVFPEIESILQESGTRDDGVRADDWGDRLADLFAASRAAIGAQIEEAERRMESLGDETAERATDEQVRAIRATMGVRPSFYDDDEVRGILNAWKRENGAFITRMADESVQEMMDEASRAVRSGRTNKEVRDGLRKRFGVTDRRARMIARTEISQLNAQITRERQRELGVTHFVWITASDERVRDEHEDREGNEYPWGDPPDGEMPGEPVNCRCSARASVDRLLNELESD